jgi:hypothetical protein
MSFDPSTSEGIVNALTFCVELIPLPFCFYKQPRN